MLGSIFIGLNILWIFVNLQLWYKYHFSNLQFYFKYPDWVLFVNIILCIVGEIVGLKVYRKETNIARGALINIAVWILCAILNQIVKW